MTDKKCPRCGLWSTGSALRCDCGYDFQKGTIEESYDTKKFPREITSFLIFIIIINLGSLFRALMNMPNDGGFSIVFILVWSGLVYFSYVKFVQKKNWGRIMLVVLTFPIGLYLLFNKEAKLYMLQINKPNENK